MREDRATLSYDDSSRLCILPMDLQHIRKENTLHFNKIGPVPLKEEGGVFGSIEVKFIVV